MATRLKMRFMSKCGAYIGGHTVVRHKRAWHYEAALAAASGIEKKRSALQQGVHDMLEARERDKAEDRFAHLEYLNRRRRRPDRPTPRKTPSIKLLKNQKL